MIRNLLLLAIASLAFFSSQSQTTEKVIIRDGVADTVYKTKIEQLLRETSILKKVEFTEVASVRFLYFQVVTINNLSTGAKEKGVYVSNLSYINLWSESNSYERHAYLDANEVDNLISFLDSCDARWKNETPSLQTLYEYETTDNLRISFSTIKNSKAWFYYIRFAGYRFNDVYTLKKSQSDELLDALKQVKKELGNQ